jgi:phosphate transport system substrate-binding protein
MASITARCSNTDYCSKADRKEEIELRPGEPLTCPECGKALAPTVAYGAKKTPSPALLAIGALLVLGGGGFAAWKLLADHHAASGTPAAGTAQPAQSSLLRLRGESVLAGPLGGTLARGFLGFIGATGATANAPQNGVITVGGNLAGHAENMTITASSAADGFAALGNGSADIVLSTREILPAEQAALKNLGDMSSPAAKHSAGIEALAVVVNPANRLTAISVPQLSGIFAGAIKDWAILGGPRAALHLAGQGAAMTGIAPAADPQAAVAAVAADPNALAVVPLHIAGAAKVLAIMVAGEPVAPTPASIVSGAYPLARRLYLYTPPASKNPLVARFADYALSETGQLVIGSAGYISATPPAIAAAPALPAPAAALDALNSGNAQIALAGLRKIDFECHFYPNTFNPDTRALRFIDQLSATLAAKHSAAYKMIVAGFSDSLGSESKNLDASRKRAEAFASILAERGLAPGKSLGFGAQNPIASNATPSGREANKRVEIYLVP